MPLKSSTHKNSYIWNCRLLTLDLEIKKSIWLIFFHKKYLMHLFLLLLRQFQFSRLRRFWRSPFNCRSAVCTAESRWSSTDEMKSKKEGISRTYFRIPRYGHFLLYKNGKQVYIIIHIDTTRRILSISTQVLIVSVCCKNNRIRADSSLNWFYLKEFSKTDFPNLSILIG